MKPLALLAACLAVAFSAGAQVYKWTDSTGKIHYGDSPPQDAKTSQVKVDAVSSYEGPPQVDNWAAVIRSAPGERPRAKPDPKTLTMYSTTWCGFCKRARAYLAAKKIPYREVDIEASKPNNDQFKQFGGQGIPMFILGDRRMRGFNEEKMELFLAAGR